MRHLAIVTFAVVVSFPVVARADEAESAYDAKDYARCALLYGQAAANGRKVALNRYNEACCHALGGKPDAALDAVEKSLGADPEQVTGMKDDADLASLVKTPRFAALEKRAAAALAAERKTQNGPLRDELLKMVEADQALRNNAGAGEQIMAVDKKNTARMKAIVAKHGWPGIKLVGKKAATGAWLLVQHADADRAFQKACLEKMHAAALLRDVDPVNVAYLEDRVALATGGKQVYGTQFVFEPKFGPSPIEDEAHVDERRAALGLEPLAEYAKTMMERYPRAPADAGVPR